MKQFILAVLLMAAGYACNAQSICSDSFADGDFDYPPWSGDDSLFLVNDLYQLQSNARVGGEICLSTTGYLFSETEWQCWVRNALSPSTQNFCRYYLMSDNADLKGSLNGYYVQFGGVSGNADSIVLYKQKGTQRTRLIGGRPGTVSQTDNTIRIRVRRDVAGNWELWSDTAGGSHFVLEGKSADTTFTTCAHLGFYAKFTSGNVRNFYVDEVYAGPPLIDTLPPVVKRVDYLSPHMIRINFSEEIDPRTAGESASYALDKGIGQPDSVYVDPVKPEVLLFFSPPLQSKTTYVLTVLHVADFSGNTAPTSFPFRYYVPGPRDLLITELMPDPSPAGGLPEQEYVEVYNASGEVINLEGCVFSDGAVSAVLPSVAIKPDSFVILCSTDYLNEFSVFGTAIGLVEFPSLNNSGDQLVLYDRNGQAIHRVQYTAAWYGDPHKADGGWSLEMCNPANPCNGSVNWSASADPGGGTPGRSNSTRFSEPDHSPPHLVSVYPLDPNRIELHFSEPVAEGSFERIQDKLLITPHLKPIGLISGDAEQRVYTVALTDSLRRQQLYVLQLNSYVDCAGNVSADGESITFGLADSVLFGDLIVNEILFNPSADGMDYVEILNRSDHIVDLKDVSVANTSADGTLKDPTRVTALSGNRIILPGQYLVLTADPESLGRNYRVRYPDLVLACQLPAFNDDEGTCALLKGPDYRLETLHYTEQMHFPLIGDPEGVSLERIDYSKSVDDRQNWTSASSTCGYGTPTSPNSQLLQSEHAETHLQINPEVFSPDNDGYHDIISFSLLVDEAGATATLSVYNHLGVLVKQVLRNQLAGVAGTVFWDGVCDDGSIAPIGIYTAYLEIIGMNGTVLREKKALVVAAKL